MLRRLDGDTEGARADWVRVRMIAPESPEAETADYRPSPYAEPVGPDDYTPGGRNTRRISASAFPSSSRQFSGCHTTV